MAVLRSDRWNVHSLPQNNLVGIGRCMTWHRPHKYRHSDMVWIGSHRYWSDNARRCILPDTCKCRSPRHRCINLYFDKGLKRIRWCLDRRISHHTPEYIDSRMFPLYRCIFRYLDKVCVGCRGCREVHTFPQYIQQGRDIWKHLPVQGESEINFNFCYWFICQRAVYNWVSKVIPNWFGFTLLRSVIQSDAKPKPTKRKLRVFASSSYWSIVLFTQAVIGHCDCFDFGYTTCT